MSLEPVTPHAWLHALYDPVETGWINLWAKKPRAHTWWHPVDKLDELGDDAQRLGERTDIWFGVGVRANQLGDGQRGGDQDVTHITALWLDIDVTDPDHHKTTHTLPPDPEAAAALAHELGPAPSALISTGGGLHAWWFLDEPLDTAAAAPLLTRWGYTWEALADAHGWHLDNVSDLARIMRVPGTLNHKSDPARPVTATLFQPDRRYGAGDLDELLHDPPPHRPTAPSSGATPGMGDRPGDQWNATVSCVDELQRAGFTHHHDDRNGDSHWVRPGKDRREGHSATVYADNGRCTMFSDALPELAKDTYDAWGLHAHLRHQADFADAARQHRRGTCPDAPSAPAAPSAEGAKGEPSDEATPFVIINGRPLPDITDEVVHWLTVANEPPVVFIRTGVLTRHRVDENDRPIVEPMSPYHLRNRINRVTDTVRVNKDGARTHVPVPLDIVQDLLANDHWPFPPLEAITEIPTLRPDGTIHATPGYDPATRRLYLPADLVVPPVPDHPTPQQVAAAVELITQDLLGDFPFDTEADAANAFGLLLTPLVRPAITGQVPLALLDAPEPGTGKGLLAQVVSMIATGRGGAARPLSTTDEEIRKMLTSVLLEGPTLIVLDNVDEAIRSPALAAVLTTDEWSDRLLGRSETISVPNRATWVATGNNLAVGGDIGRRCYRVRLDAHQARPYTRTGFRHDDLLEHAHRHRGAIVAALLTIARSWWAANCPPALDQPTIGGFTPWARTIGGILNNAKVTGFLANLNELHASLDIEGESWEGFLTALAEEFDDRRVTAGEIASSIESEYTQLRDVVPAELVGALGRPTLAKRLGEAFRKREGRRHGSAEIAVLATGKNRNKTVLWSVVAMSDAETVDTLFDTAQEATSAVGEPVQGLLAPLDPLDADKARGPRGHAGTFSTDAQAVLPDVNMKTTGATAENLPASPRGPRAPQEPPRDDLIGF